ncbi:MAG: hypothetical protein HY855_26465 [Burkholderiales bacterium]|nr:hypothetical protein [Burkholderiales bacterium]
MPPTPEPSAPLPPVDPYRPASRRQRLRVVGLTLLTVIVLWLLLLYRPGGNPYRYVTAASAPVPCRPGQQTGCVGGQANVLLLPAASAPSR